MSAPHTPAAVRRTGLERALGVFTDVRHGEASTALLLTVNVFLILCSYSLLKVLREPLILAGGGAELKAYSAAGQAILLLIAVPLYGALANRYPRRRLINVVTGFFLVCLTVFFVLAQMGTPVGVPFFLWLGIFNVMVIAQFWSFANDVYTTEEGKRLFPIVAFGQSAGAVLGAYLAGVAIDSLGLYPIFLVAAGLLVVATVFTNLIDTRERRRTEAARTLSESTAMMPASTKEVRLESGAFRIADLRAEAEAAPAPPKSAPPPAEAKTQPIGKGDAFRLVFQNRYLLLIALLILVLNWVNTTGQYVLDRTVTKAAMDAVASGQAGGRTEGEFIGKFYSSFQLVVNVIGLAAQLFLVSRILKWFGVRVAILILPVIALFGYGALAFVPVLGVVRWVKTAENATDYSVQNTVRQVLFLPTTREQKYKAKQAIDSFFVRAGDVLSALLVYVGTTVLALQTQQFAIVNMVLVGFWLVLAVWIGREYGRLAAQVEVEGEGSASR